MLMGFMAFILKVLTKMDLVTDKHRKAELQSYLNPDPEYILKVLDGRSTPKQHKLNAAIASLIEDFSLVSFVPMDREDEDSVSLVLQQVDNCMQYGEDEEVRENNNEAEDAAGGIGAGGAE